MARKRTTIEIASEEADKKAEDAVTTTPVAVIFNPTPEYSTPRRRTRAGNVRDHRCSAFPCIDKAVSNWSEIGSRLVYYEIILWT